MQDRSPQDVYAKLLSNSRGYPLWFPEPSNTLPTSYQQDGIQIGDVGVVDAAGRFDVLFNICQSPHHALHQRRGILDDFKLDPIGVDFNQEVDVRSNADPPGFVLSSRGIKRERTGSLPNVDSYYEFVPTYTEGAILILPDGAIRHDLLPKELFRETAIRHAFDWYKIARKRYGESIGGRSLYLITGFSKTRSWSLASFPDAPGIQQNPHIRVVEKDGRDGQPPRRYWESTFHVDSRDGPGGNHNVNQTVYISGFKIAVRGDVLRWWAQEPVVESVPAERPRPRPFRCVRALKKRFGGKHGAKYPRRTGRDGDVNHVPALAQPFHPSDNINRFMLNKDPDALVAVTHDEQWISMIESGKLVLEDFARDGRLEELLEKNYSLTPRPENSGVYLENKIGRADHKTPPTPDKSSFQHESYKPEKFWFPTPSSHQTHIAITRIRAENVSAGLRRFPSGFSVLVEFDGSQRRTKNKPVRLDESITEWDDFIQLPAELSTNVQLTVSASYEISPMLGKGDVLFTQKGSIEQWMENTRPITFSPMGGMDDTFSCSLLVTVERQTLNYMPAVLSQNSNSDWDGSSELAQTTDLGHNTLLQYRNHPKKKTLDTSLQHFRRAAEICPSEHRYRAAVLRNLAMVTFFQCQVTGAYSDLESTIACYQEALDLCPASHPDRLATLLYLAQALTYRYGKHGREETVLVEIKDLMTEIPSLSLVNVHEHRAAELILQTCKRYEVISRGDATELNQLIEMLKGAIKVSPNYFDKPQRLYNLSAALRERFDVHSKVDDLVESIAANEQAVELSLPGDPDRPGMLVTLGASLLGRFESMGDIADLEKSISVNKETVQLTVDGHLDRPELLTTYGIGLLRRFEKARKPADLDKSFSSLERAVDLAPVSHPKRSWMFLNLGNTSFSRFQRFGEPGDLDKSISAVQEALQLAPDNQLSRSEMLAVLGVLYLIRFRLLGVFDHLQQSIDTVWEAIQLIPGDHPSRFRLHGILGTSLLIRYQKHSELPDLAKSISMVQQALRPISEDHPIRDNVLNTLCTSIITGFQRFGKLGDLGKTLSVIDPDKIHRAAQDSRPDQPELLSDLYAVLDSLAKKRY